MSKIVSFIKNTKMFILAVLITVIIYINNHTLGMNIVKTFGKYFVNTIPILLLMFALLAFIKRVMNSTFFEEKLSKGSQVQKTLFAYLFGTIVSGPIYPGYILGKMLIEKGIKMRVVIIMLSVWSTLKIPMLPYEIDILGWKMTIVRWIVTSILIYLLALICEYIVTRIEKKVCGKDKNNAL